MAERAKMELRKIFFKAAYAEKLFDAILFEYPHGSWALIIGENKIADIHYYGVPGWDVQFKDTTYFGQADKDEILLLMGVPLSEKYPANGYVPREAARLTK